MPSGANPPRREMPTSILIIITVLLLIAIGNFFRTPSAAGIRAVDFVSIFAIGMLFGVLVTSIALRVGLRRKR